MKTVKPNFDTVNPHFIYDLLSGLTGLADVDEEVDKLSYVDSNNQDQVKNLIKTYLLPRYQNGTIAYQQTIKFNLSYYLTTNAINFEEVYDSGLLPIECPKSARLFFEWIWQVYFPDENYILRETKLHRTSNDIYEPHRIWANNYNIKET
jgi:hypothetical protein